MLYTRYFIDDEDRATWREFFGAETPRDVIGMCVAPGVIARTQEGIVRQIIVLRLNANPAFRARYPPGFFSQRQQAAIRIARYALSRLTDNN